MAGNSLNRLRKKHRSSIVAYRMGIYSSEQQGGLAFCPHEYVGRFQFKFLYVAFLGCSVTLPY